MNKVVTSLLFAGLVLAAACDNESANTATAQNIPMAPVLAKAKLTEANAAAKQWKPDAILIQVGTHGVGADGKHVMWDYGYYSAAAKKCVVVNVGPNGASTTESGDETCASGELKQFIDSDQASTIARTNGVTAQQATLFASVAQTPQGARPTWSVMDESGTKPGNVMLDIDASSGAVLSKTTQ